MEGHNSMKVDEDTSSEGNKDVLPFAFAIIFAVVFFNLILIYICRYCLTCFHFLDFDEEDDDVLPLIQTNRMNTSRPPTSFPTERLHNMLGYNIPRHRQQPPTLSQNELGYLSPVVTYRDWLYKRRAEKNKQNVQSDNLPIDKLSHTFDKDPFLLGMSMNSSTTKFSEKSSFESKVSDEMDNYGQPKGSCSREDNANITMNAEDANQEEEDDFCTICYANYDYTDYLRVLPCGHLFHAQCIDTWMTTSKASCPLCNEDYSRKHYKSKNYSASSSNMDVLAHEPVNTQLEDNYAAPFVNPVLSFRDSRMPFFMNSAV
ncbi:ubiquitin-protein ligase E3 [Schizosaccharomyces cryophilus OY26]|uniref:Ubiquitin-protein ligase E3 n=1 Tax=Schizosaccharomyces cryophilus (strain OY26 / ATCC MYA-4695 / CBS 11777 / NBRC 106824 / NRRL Y48691) TaxID=653667 RepID=S9VST8_SCHCR|nr:ubiquitin-protein ligase E3 [Schizosaccharomyces cryophilus OY26]EPY50948.1 ubiquitin-protein ligase E3 [Schizosaccharomyces cryophilus OY26]